MLPIVIVKSRNRLHFISYQNVLEKEKKNMKCCGLELQYSVMKDYDANNMITSFSIYFYRYYDHFAESICCIYLKMNVLTT